MLGPIAAAAMLPEIFSRRIWIGRRPGNGVKLVIAKNAARRASIDHPPHDIDGRHLARAAIDEVANENRGALRVTPRTLRFAIAEHFEQAEEFFGMPVDVADDVERFCSQFLLLSKTCFLS